MNIIGSKTYKKYRFQDPWTLSVPRPPKNIGSKTHRIYRFQDPWKLPVRRPLPAPRPMTAFLRMDRPWVLEQVFFHGSWTRYLPVLDFSKSQISSNIIQIFVDDLSKSYHHYWTTLMIQNVLQSEDLSGYHVRTHKRNYLFTKFIFLSIFKFYKVL